MATVVTLVHHPIIVYFIFKFASGETGHMVLKVKPQNGRITPRFSHFLGSLTFVTDRLLFMDLLALCKDTVGSRHRSSISKTIG